MGHLRLATSAPRRVQMSAPLWDISVEDDGTTIVVRPVGEIDSYTAAQVNAHLRGCGNGHKAIVLDVSQVEFMDSTGLTMLIQAHRREPERFALRGNSPAVERLLELSGTSQLFTRA
jgi:anti-sigma B factor antagonist